MKTISVVATILLLLFVHALSGRMRQAGTLQDREAGQIHSERAARGGTGNQPRVYVL